MTMKRNRDLKAELGEAQIAAQNWEDRFIEAREALAGEQHELQVMHDSHALIMLKNLELRNELGQASRELMAVSEQLDVCRKERGEALDALHRLRSAVVDLDHEDDPDLNEVSDFEVVQP